MGKLSYKLKRGGLLGSRITAEARGADAKAAATRDTTSVCLGGLSGLGDIECGRAWWLWSAIWEPKIERLREEGRTPVASTVLRNNKKEGHFYFV
jgi:hypothetical protein